MTWVVAEEGEAIQQKKAIFDGSWRGRRGRRHCGAVESKDYNVMVSGRRGRKSRTIGDENGATVRDACERIVDRTNERKYD